MRAKWLKPAPIENTQADQGNTARIAGGMYLTPVGYAVYASPLKWVIMLAPLALVHARDEARAARAIATLQAAYEIGDAPPAATPCVIARIADCTLAGIVAFDA